MKKISLFVMILFVSITSFAQKEMSKNKKALLTSVEKHKNELIKISDVKYFNYPASKSVKKLTQSLMILNTNYNKIRMVQILKLI